jgi:hypothetical protein
LIQKFVQQYLEAFDTTFFDDSLVQIIQLTLHPYGTDFKLTRTQTHLKNIGGVTTPPLHQRKLHIDMKITLSSTQEASLIPREDRLRNLIMVLLHEMNHAFFASASPCTAEAAEHYHNVRVLAALIGN